jgi:ribonuclease HI
MSSFFVDGFSNAKICGYIVTDPDGNILKQEIFKAKKYTNNQTEYLAVIAACKLADFNDILYLDSQLVVGHSLRGWKQNCAQLIPLCNIVKSYIKQKNLKLRWVSRKENVAGIYVEKNMKKLIKEK